MNCRTILLTAAALPALLLPSIALAQAPAQLRGKSVVASWTENRLQRLSSETEFSQRSVPQTLSVYISDEGRVFAKRTALSSKSGGQRPRSSGSTSSVGEGSESGQGGHVSGHTLIVANKMISGGARMARIEFNQDFSGCTANVVVGREGANTVAHGRSLASGQALEIKSATVSDTSCSVQSGNVFGN